jgi:sortase A
MGGAPRRSLPRRVLRVISHVLIVTGVLVIAWGVLVWQWQDPFSALYTEYQQHQLTHQYHQVLAKSRPVTHVAAPSDLPAVLAREASAYRRTLQVGHPVGLIRVPRLGLKMVVVQGTDDSSLRKGPGHYPPSGLPGQGELIYIAGHRTTFMAPFAAINTMRIGDTIQLSVPYGTFTYRTVRHYIVPANDVSLLQNGSREVLRLQACHPRFFATNRYIVDAIAVSVTLPGGRTYRLGR